MEPPAPAFSVGQLVYPIVGGVWQTLTPVPIVDVARHTDGVLYYAVEGTETRYPEHQLERVDLADDGERNAVLEALLEAAGKLGWPPLGEPLGIDRGAASWDAWTDTASMADLTEALSRLESST